MDNVTEVDESHLATVWQSLLAEMNDPDWRYVGIANLQNFTSSAESLDFGDGLSIRQRSQQYLNDRLQWDEHKWQLLAQEWSDIGASEYILEVQHREPKQPENVILMNSAGLTERAERLLLALRLFAEGDIRIGRMVADRSERFRLRPGGITLVGMAFWNPGPACRLESSDVPAVKELYELLRSFEANFATKWPNVTFALRSFIAIYGRLFQQGADRVIDAITTLEGLLGDSSTELTYKLCVRTASLLAASDDERVRVFDEMKLYYDTRSRIVHGLKLRPSNRAVIQDSSPLRHVARRVLVGYIRIATAGAFRDSEALKLVLDTTLLHVEHRAVLRRFAGLLKRQFG